MLRFRKGTSELPFEKLETRGIEGVMKLLQRNEEKR